MTARHATVGVTSSSIVNTETARQIFRLVWKDKRYGEWLVYIYKIDSVIIIFARVSSPRETMRARWDWVLEVLEVVEARKV